MRASVIIPKSHPAAKLSRQVKPHAAAASAGKGMAKAGSARAGVSAAAAGKRPVPAGEVHAMEAAARQLSKGDLDRDVKTVYKSLL